MSPKKDKTRDRSDTEGADRPNEPAGIRKTRNSSGGRDSAEELAKRRKTGNSAGGLRSNIQGSNKLAGEPAGEAGEEHGKEPGEEHGKEPGEEHGKEPGEEHGEGVGTTFDMPPPKKTQTRDSSGGRSNIPRVDRSNNVETVTPSREDYNERSRERTELLTRLKSALGGVNVKTAFWACCQLGDMESLETLTRIAELSPSLVLDYFNQAAILPLQWSQGFRDPLASKASSNGSKSRKNSDEESWVERWDRERYLVSLPYPILKTPDTQCLKRDNERCVLTKTRCLEVAHIFPYCMLNKPEITSQRPYNIPNFWSLLRQFWTDKQVDSWRYTIFPDLRHPDTGIDACFNLICLGREAHNQWNQGLFALKPLERSDDEKKLTVQFFWQPQYDHQRKDLIDLLKEPLTSEGVNLIPEGYWLGRRQDDGSLQDIQQGQIFTLTTDNPKDRPLPSWELMEMQWFLQRITAMSGAAGTPDVDLNNDDDMNSGSILIPDDNNGDVRSSEREYLYEWIQPPPQLQDSSPDMAEPARSKPDLENPKIARKRGAGKRGAKAGQQWALTAPCRREPGLMRHACLGVYGD